MSIFTAHDGTRLHFDTLDDPEGSDPLVVVAGGPGLDARYLGDLGGLTRLRTLVRPHPRASGLSPVPDDAPATRAGCGFAAQAQDLEALREHLGLSRLDLLAHSAGALVAQAYAAAHPDRVRRLVLVTPVGRAAREPDEAELAALRAVRGDEPWYPDARAAQCALDAGTLSPAEAVDAAAALVPFSWGQWREELRATAYPDWLVPAQPWIRAAFYADATSAPEPVPVPVLVIAGGRDGLIGTAPARLVADLHPAARLEVLADCGHRPWTERPELFAELVQGFLAAPETPER